MIELSSPLIDQNKGIFSTSKDFLLKRIESTGSLSPIVNQQNSIKRRHSYMNQYQKSIEAAAKRQSALKFNRRSLRMEDECVLKSVQLYKE